MCGRTACSLGAELLRRACAYRDRRGRRRQPEWVREERYRPSYNKGPQSSSPVLLSRKHLQQVAPPRPGAMLRFSMRGAGMGAPGSILGCSPGCWGWVLAAWVAPCSAWVLNGLMAGISLLGNVYVILGRVGDHRHAPSVVLSVQVCASNSCL